MLTIQNREDLHKELGGAFLSAQTTGGEVAEWHARRAYELQEIGRIVHNNGWFSTKDIHKAIFLIAADTVKDEIKTALVPYYQNLYAYPDLQAEFLQEALEYWLDGGSPWDKGVVGILGQKYYDKWTKKTMNRAERNWNKNRG